MARRSSGASGTACKGKSTSKSCRGTERSGGHHLSVDDNRYPDRLFELPQVAAAVVALDAVTEGSLVLETLSLKAALLVV